MRTMLAIFAAVMAIGCWIGGPLDAVRPPPAARFPDLAPVSAWETGTWSERLDADRGRTPLILAGPGGDLRPAMATRWREVRERSGAPCWRFRLSPGEAERVADDWTARLAEGDPALVELLSGVRGVPPPSGVAATSGLRADRRGLTVCTLVRDASLPFRIAHPAAWPRIGGPRAPSPATGFAVRYGRDIDRAASGEDRPRRAAEWDATWGLWMNPRARWASDPAFRAWLARSVDRDDLARAILGDHGRGTTALLDDPGAAVPDLPASRPFSGGARPRLSLAHQARDPVATAIASRLKARLAESGVEVDLLPGAILPLAAIGRERAPSMVLFAHRPASPDPALGLLETIAGLGPSAADAADALRRRSFEEAEARTVRARAVQDDLLRSGLLIPLVRGEAWVEGDLGGWRPAPGGRLVRGRGERP